MAGNLYTPFIIQATVTAGGTTTHTLVRPIAIYAASNYATVAAGGGTVAITTAGGSAVTAWAMAVDKVVTQAVTATPANLVAAAGTTLSFVGAAAASGIVTVHCVTTDSEPVVLA
jgi:hypothetical protein